MLFFILGVFVFLWGFQNPNLFVIESYMDVWWGLVLDINICQTAFTLKQWSLALLIENEQEHVFLFGILVGLLCTYSFSMVTKYSKISFLLAFPATKQGWEGCAPLNLTHFCILLSRSSLKITNQENTRNIFHEILNKQTSLSICFCPYFLMFGQGRKCKWMENENKPI